ncbi:MAG: PhnD/SsuA/transferrin family substrate-binding protein [Geminocystis sp.]|nr:PhnD/SsuA/transferrin family substrate-binding protein [Geminocystis sp.]HIK37038.1 PhnD/SsuA/transferrin family substrate-binding protein [Geminocystis sp. M7585_C2015_104]MCS7147286.1 PhnD/SsuA/transferrin family substrate-binding protein [Geminocystis sp.]MCX8078830.1 PhnD/SsuA/transferrin family substrate-binding protein [Geminocystis sp.]MDW8116285.1 PhnD/SsuA/transferrin family substrate-binding protein [Geminocystis sp.]
MRIRKPKSLILATVIMVNILAGGTTVTASIARNIIDKTIDKTETPTEATVRQDTLVSQNQPAISNDTETPTPPQQDSSRRAYKIGVLALRGKENALRRWQATADYLTREVPEAGGFEIVALDFREIEEATKKGTIDFVLTNPGMFVDLETDYDIYRIATMKNKKLGRVLTEFGGVIFRRRDRNDIQTLKDLKGKTMMAVDEKSLGGWQAQWLEMKKAGINPYRDLKELTFAGEHDKVVYAVRDGKVDVGAVRTDVLESMQEEGKIKLEDFVVINQRTELADRFPFLVSTDLYPEWPFSATKNTPPRIAELVSSALLKMPEDAKAAKDAGVGGWTVPGNYRKIDDLFYELQIGRYEHLRKLNWVGFVQKYWYLFSGGAILVVILIATFIIYQQQQSRKAIEKLAEERKQEKERLEKEIYQLIEEVQGALEGDLTVRASLTSMEMSTVADLFNAITDSLRDIALEARVSSNEVVRALGDNAEFIQMLASQALAESRKTREALESIETMSEQVNQVAQTANKVSFLAEDAYQETQKSSSVMDDTVEGILRVRGTIAETAKKMKILGESSQKISQAVSLIEEIALKTTLLAINASVEASRAGEQGQGFTIVAEQVGALAEQSAEATKTIAQMVAEIQQETQDVAEAMEMTTAEVVYTTNQVESAKQSLNQVLELSRSIDELMKYISESTASQTETSRKLTQLMEELARESEERLQLSQKVAESIISTANIAKQLQSAVEKFKVD